MHAPKRQLPIGAQIALWKTELDDIENLESSFTSFRVSLEMTKQFFSILHEKNEFFLILGILLLFG